MNPALALYVLFAIRSSTAANSLRVCNMSETFLSVKQVGINHLEVGKLLYFCTLYTSQLNTRPFLTNRGLLK